MKISKQSLDIIKSFSQINPSIYISEGSRIKTQPPLNSTIVAIANVPELFPKSFAIYDLQRFLSIISLFDDPEFDFNDEFVLISEGSNKVKYWYAAENMIVHPPYDKDIKFKPSDETIEFDLKEADLNRVLKAVGFLRTPEISIIGDGTNVSIATTNNKVATSDSFSVIVGQSDRVFNAIISTDNLKIIVRDYAVTLATKGLVNFKSEDVEYFVALNKTSTFE